jgi:hypothetical protein
VVRATETTDSRRKTIEGTRASRSGFSYCMVVSAAQSHSSAMESQSIRYLQQAAAAAATAAAAYAGDQGTTYLKYACIIAPVSCLLALQPAPHGRESLTRLGSDRVPLLTTSPDSSGALCTILGSQTGPWGPWDAMDAMTRGARQLCVAARPRCCQPRHDPASLFTDPPQNSPGSALLFAHEAPQRCHLSPWARANIIMRPRRAPTPRSSVAVSVHDSMPSLSQRRPGQPAQSTIAMTPRHQEQARLASVYLLRPVANCTFHDLASIPAAPPISEPSDHPSCVIHVRDAPFTSAS